MQAKETTTGRSASLTGGVTGDLEREFVVTADNRSDDQYTIYASGLIPLHGSPHPRNFMASLRRFRFKCEMPFIWRVTCEYSTRPEGQQQNNALIQVPWFRPAIVTGGFLSQSENPSKDAYNKPYNNSADTPFSQTPSIEDDRPTFHIRKNVPSLPTWFYSLKRKRNSAPVVIRNEIGVVISAPQYSLKYKPLGFSEVKREGPNNMFRYIEVSYELAFDEDLWELNIRDRGRFFKPPRAGRMQRVIPFDEGGEQNLNGFGEPLTPGDTPKTIKFRPYGQADFSVLPTS